MSEENIGQSKESANVEGTDGGDVVSSCKRDLKCADVDEEESVSTPNAKKVKMDELVHGDRYC